jgi:ferredoxin/flavodoxin
MKTITTVHMAYFSGTGGTARVAGALERAFRSRGLDVRMEELSGQPCEWAEADLHVVAYPVYAFNAPVPVDEWIARAPTGNGAAAVVVSVSGGGEVSPNTACRASVIQRLEAKGYQVEGEAMFVMPANCLIAYDDALCAMLLRAAPIKAEAFVSELLSGNGKRLRPRPLDRVAARLCAAEKFGGRMFGRQLKALPGCTGCGWCASHCPRGNIALEGGRPRFGGRCVVCLRCLYGCPKRAITPGIGKSFILSQGFDLNVLEARTGGMTEFSPASEVAKGKAFEGVRAYLADVEGRI